MTLQNDEVAGIVAAGGSIHEDRHVTEEHCRTAIQHAFDPLLVVIDGRRRCRSWKVLILSVSEPSLVVPAIEENVLCSRIVRAGEPRQTGRLDGSPYCSTSA